MNELNLKISHISKSFSKPVLRDINLSMKNGDFVSIVGKSGMGKSTLMNIIGLIEKYDSGSFIFNGTKIKNKSDYANIRLENIGFIFQSYNLLSELSVQDNILLPSVYKRCNIDKGYFESLLEMLNIDKLINQKVGTLSGGEKQRVGIARALILDPCLIIADEPTGNLDVNNRDVICDLLKNENEKGRGILLITHDLEVANIASRKYRLIEGVLEEYE